MASTIGERLRVTLFGQSHGEAIGVVLDGLPAGERIAMDALQAFLDRRAPGRGGHASARREADRPRLLSGVVDGVTCGAPLCAVIENGDVDPSAYDDVKDVPRPGHADYPALQKHGQAVDLRGGGHHSGRLTAPLCVAGGIALQLLSRRGIAIGAHIRSIGGVQDAPFDPVAPTREMLEWPGKQPFPVLDAATGEEMRRRIAEAGCDGDSLGGTIECCAIGLPPGLGGPVFGGVENRLGEAMFGIPGVRGLSFGDGFAAADERGSRQNDPYRMEAGAVVTETNHHGGVLGGMTTGMPLLLTVACKPTPSIARPQRSLRLSTGEQEEIAVRGRHDGCFVPRAAPCVEAVVAIVLLDLLLVEGKA